MSDATPGSPGWAATDPRAVARPIRRRAASRCSASPTPSATVLHRMVQSSAPNEVIEAAAADLEAVAERFSSYTNKSMYEGFAESANAGEPFGFFDHSPMLGRANPLAPPIDLWLEGDRMVGTATFGAAYEGPPGLRARRLRGGRLRRGARLDAVAVGQPGHDRPPHGALPEPDPARDGAALRRLARAGRGPEDLHQG